MRVRAVYASDERTEANLSRNRNEMHQTAETATRM